MNRTNGKVHFDETTTTVIVDYASEAGAGGRVHVDLDTAEAIHDAFERAGNPLDIEGAGLYTVMGVDAAPYDGELHLLFQVAGGAQAVFVLAAPGMTQGQVADISEAMRAIFVRLSVGHQEGEVTGIR